MGKAQPVNETAPTSSTRPENACGRPRVEAHPIREHASPGHTTATGTEKTSPAKTKPPIVSTEHAGPETISPICFAWTLQRRATSKLTRDLL
ncbi:hypothetical protein BRARA_H01601 [Brassica rapa]|uniref:Uncharacterized protein n=1 Tax=Brassica campestris TaxID=3711 RepID=A0A397YBS6_BRACM|nr:hypothetical protein BRARA_H01601 [Brassica rapa]